MASAGAGAVERGCQEPNSGPLEDQQVFLITEPALQPREQISVWKKRLRHGLSPSLYNGVWSLMEYSLLSVKKKKS